MREIHGSNGIRNPVGFIFIQLLWLSFCYSAITASARADIPKNHEGCDTVRPAFTQIRAHRFLANSVEIQTIQKLSKLMYLWPKRSLHL
jgi:hypothetical protein